MTSEPRLLDADFFAAAVEIFEATRRLERAVRRTHLDGERRYVDWVWKRVAGVCRTGRLPAPNDAQRSRADAMAGARRAVTIEATLRAHGVDAGTAVRPGLSAAATALAATAARVAWHDEPEPAKRARLAVFASDDGLALADKYLESMA